MNINLMKESNLSPLPVVNSTERNNKSFVPLGNRNNILPIYNNTSTNKEKYKRSVSHNRSTHFNENLALLLSENKKKESEIEKNEKVKARMMQARHKNDLWHQIKQSKDMQNQIKKSSMDMDEQYIQL